MKKFIKILFIIQVLFLAVFLLTGSENIAYEHIGIYYNPIYTIIYLKDVLYYGVTFLNNLSTVLSVVCAFITILFLIVYDNIRKRKKIHIYKIFGYSDVGISLKNSLDLLKWLIIPSVLCLVIDTLIFKIFTDLKIYTIATVSIVILSIANIIYFVICFISTYFITKYNSIQILKGSAKADIVYGIRYLLQWIGIVLSFTVMLLFAEIREEIVVNNINDLMPIYKTGFSLIVSVFASLVIMFIVLLTYYNKNKYKIVIKNIYGYSVFEKYKKLILGLIFILGTAIVPFYFFGYEIKYLLVLSLYYLAFEFIFIYIIHNKLEKQHINRVIKGE